MQEAGRVVLDRLGLSMEDRIRPQVVSTQVITRIDPYQSQLLNRFRRGSMLVPGETMLVATHQADLAGARACGLATAFVERPLEMGPGGGKDDARDPRFDLHATDFNDLAGQLGC